MAKKSDAVFLDGGLDRIDDCNRLNVCAGEPTNFANLTATRLASVTMTPGSGAGDYLKANGDVSGRKLSVLQQADIPISTSGSADHVVLDDGTNIYVTTCTTQALTSGGTVTVPVWDIEIAAPT
jgi:hypothetical protein